MGLIARIFGPSRKADLAARVDHNTTAILRRLDRMENTMSATFTDLNTKVDRIATLLDAKSSTVDDHATELATLKSEQASEVDELNTKLDAIIAKHDTPAPAVVDTTTSTTIDPVTGLPTT